MRKEQSKLEKEGYVKTSETKDYITATKDDEKYSIKTIHLTELSIEAETALMSEIEVFQQKKHPHLRDMGNSFKDETQNIYYIITKECPAGSLADRIGNNPGMQESEILRWFVEICIALKAMHEAHLVHKDLTPKKILFSEFGLVCLGELENIPAGSRSSNPAINYVAPEVLKGSTYDAKSDIWSLGCILYELCTQQQAFSETTTDKLTQKITSANYQPLPHKFSPELGSLLSDLLKKDHEERPTASEILAYPITIRCLITKCKNTVQELKTNVTKLRTLADGLEKIHKYTTIGSLGGSVFGALGGITTIVGLILSPFTLGASLIVTGVGVGVAAAGGLAGGGASILNMVNQSSDRKAIRSNIKELDHKINAVLTWLLEINNGLQTIKSQCPQTSDNDSELTGEHLTKFASRAAKGLGGIPELIRLVSVINMGKVVAQASRAVRAVEAVTGVLAGLFVMVDIFFIVMDANEVHRIREAQRRGTASSLNKNEIRSEIMKFVISVREAAENFEKVLNDLKDIISSITPFK